MTKHAPPGFSRRAFAAGSIAAALGPTASLFGRDGRPPRVLIRSSWQTVNIGDVAHTPGMVRILNDAMPEVELALWPSGLGERERRMLRRNFPKLAIVESPEDVRREFDRADFLLHGSGPSIVGVKALAEWRAKTGKPYGVLGVTLGSLDDATRAVLDGARFLYLRDSISLEFARSQDLKCPVVDFAPDAAFGVNLRDDASALPFLERNGLEIGKYLCVIPRLRYTPYWLVRKKPMTDLDKAKDEVNRRMKERDHATIREAVTAFVRSTTHRVLLCPEDMSHMAVGKEMLLEKFPDDVRRRCAWREDFWLTDEAVSVYARSIGLLSMDMHSPIMAVANGVPAVHCRFREQTSKGRMWRDVGLGDWLFDLDVETDGSNIAKALLDLAARPEAARARVAKAMAFVNAKQADAARALRRSLP